MCCFYSLKASSDASRLGLNTYIVRDAGRTQIAPGTKTVVCVGPGSELCLSLLISDMYVFCVFSRSSNTGRYCDRRL